MSLILKCLLPLLLPTLALALSQGAVEEHQEIRATSVLFRQFETVAYAKRDVVMGADNYGHVAKRDADILRFPFYEFKDALKSLGGDALTNIMTNSGAIVVGARNFRPPSGLGPVHSERCYIVILNGKLDIQKYFSRPPLDSIQGTRIWSWSANLGEFGEEKSNKESSFYIAQLAGSYLLMSNTADGLRATIKELSSPSDSKAVPAIVRDWDIVRKKELWAYRHYRRSGVVDREAAGLSFVTSNTDALIFFVDFDKNVSVIRLLCTNTKEDAAAKINRLNKLPLLKAQARGVWESTIPLAGDETSFERLTVVMDFLGFGVYL